MFIKDFLKRYKNSCYIREEQRKEFSMQNGIKKIQGGHLMMIIVLQNLISKELI